MRSNVLSFLHHKAKPASRERIDLNQHLTGDEPDRFVILASPDGCRLEIQDSATGETMWLITKPLSFEEVRQNGTF